MTIDCPCFFSSITDLEVPWTQHPRLNPAGDRLYFVYAGASNEIRVHSVPSMTHVETIIAPTMTTSGRVGSPAGIAIDDGGTLYYGAMSEVTFSGFDPDRQWESEVWSYDGSSWTQVWSDSYFADPAPPAGTYESLVTSGLTFDPFLDDVYFITTDDATARVRGLSSVVTSAPHADLGSEWGSGHFVVQPSDGSIWVTRHATTSPITRRFRRYTSGFGSHIDIDYEPELVLSPSRAIPSAAHDDHMLAVARAGGSGTFELHRFDATGTVVETHLSSCGARLDNVTYTSDLSRVMSAHRTGSSSPAALADWTLRCTPDPAVGGIAVGFLAL